MNSAKHRISRRGFTRVLGATAAYAALNPMLPGRLVETGTNETIVRLSSNENPYGPSPAALKAMTDAFGLAWRYPDEHADMLLANVARFHNVSPDQVLLGNGSGEILKLAAAAFTGPTRRLVVADPTFEAIARHASVAKAETIKVPLTSDYYHHDLPKMLDQSNVGLTYVCNPNNPTASITPKSQIRSFLDSVGPSTMVLVDEAYHHYVESSEYESVIPLVKQRGNLIVARTFSKIYGMAGLRCGYCVSSPDLIRQMQAHQVWDSLNIMALAAAIASFGDSNHVEQGRLRNHEVKKFVYAELQKLGFKWIPSEANFLMIDLQRPSRSVIAALRDRKVEVGRLFPTMPNFLRVTIGTKPQMEAFCAAFSQIMRSA